MAMSSHTQPSAEGALHLSFGGKAIHLTLTSEERTNCAAKITEFCEANNMDHGLKQKALSAMDMLAAEELHHPHVLSSSSCLPSSPPQPLHTPTDSLLSSPSHSGASDNTPSPSDIPALPVPDNPPPLLPFLPLPFWCAYDSLMQISPSVCHTLPDLEHSYAAALREARERKDKALAELQLRQSLEMELAMQQSDMADGMVQGQEEGDDESPTPITELVNQHVAELEALERHWTAELQSMQRQQLEEYRDLILDLFAYEVTKTSQSTPLSLPPLPCAEPPPDSALPHTPTEAGTAAQTSTRPTSRAASFIRSLRSVADKAKRGRKGGRLRLLTSHADDSAVPSAPVTSPSNASASQRSAEHGEGGTRGSGKGEWWESMVPTGALKEEAAIRVGFGAQQKEICILRLCSGHVLDVLKPTPHPAAHSPPPSSLASVLRDSPPDLLSPPRYTYDNGHHDAFASAQWGADDRMAAPLAYDRRLKGGLRGEVPVAYGDALSGVVLPTPERLQFDTQQDHQLADACESSPDFHFPPLNQQRKLACQYGPLRVGDFFITRHTNLPAVQAVIHVLVSSDEAPSDQLPPDLQAALQRVLEVCSENSVRVLTLPVLMEAETSLAYAPLQRRIQHVFRLLKSTLAQIADRPPGRSPPFTLRIINLVLSPACFLPPAAAHEQGDGVCTSYRSLVDDAVAFLTHSFPSF